MTTGMTYKSKLIDWADTFTEHDLVAENDLDPNDFLGALENACEEALKTIDFLDYQSEFNKEEGRRWEAIYNTALQHAKNQTEEIISLKATIAQLNEVVDRFEKEKKGEIPF